MFKWKQLLLVVCVFFITSTHAQNKPLACQGDASAGLKWDNGKWNVTRFQTDKFILVLKDTNLDENSVSKVFTDDLSVECKTGFKGKIRCLGSAGQVLFFDPSTMKGAFSFLFGGTLIGEPRDTLSIDAFSCQPF